MFRFKSKSNCNTYTKVSKITKQTRIGREDDLKYEGGEGSLEDGGEKGE